MYIQIDINVINMELRHFIMIREVAKYGNLTKAAEQLFLSQSALSHQLKDIESYFGTQIFIRQNKQMLITKTGKVILDSAEKIIAELDETTKAIKNITLKDAGEIRISTECFTSYHWLSSFLSDFKKLYPLVEIAIHPEATYQSISHILENKIDIGIVADNKHPKLNYTELFKDEFFAVVPSGHHWTKLKWVEPAHFHSENFIMYTIPNEKSAIYQFLFSEKAPKKMFKIALTEAICQMVKANIGVAVLPNWIIRPYVESGQLVPVQITRKSLKRTWYAATLKNKEIPPYMTSFIKTLSRHLKQSEELTPLAVKS
jgi:LysR family transcriptional regulator for metE and metH